MWIWSWVVLKISGGVDSTLHKLRDWCSRYKFEHIVNYRMPNDNQRRALQVVFDHILHKIPQISNMVLFIW